MVEGVEKMTTPKVVEKVEGVGKVDRPQEVGLLEVTLDTPIEVVIESDKKGWKVVFDETPGKFKRLSEGDLNQLHRVTQASYLVSERYHKAALDAAENPRATVSDIRQSARATDRLFVGNKRPDMAYSWKRPDEIKKAVAYEGWKVESDNRLETFRKPVGGTYTVSAVGDDELLLLSRPKDLHDAHLREAVEKSDRQRGSIEKATVSGDRNVFLEGDSRLDPKGKQWKDVGPSGDST